MSDYFTILDVIVLLVYFLGTMGIGFYFWSRSRSSESFTAAGRSLPGWVCGLSIFATYLSSISYLALPGKSFADNWNPFVFSLAVPIATVIAVRFFIPYYRASNEVSAYALLEHRFGLWARVYVSLFYLLTQIARMGIVMYLMALPMQIIFGWDIYTVILVTGVSVTIYAFVGGITAVIWADAVQAIVLMLGAVVSLVVMLVRIPGGPSRVIEVAAEHNKFSLGSFELLNVSAPTFWVVLLYGLFINLQNFGIDQSYIQRYIAAKSEREAKKACGWVRSFISPLRPVFFIGSTLFTYYDTQPQKLDEIKTIVAEQKVSYDNPGLTGEAYKLEVAETAAGLGNQDIGDRVFLFFIARELPPGVTGLLVAAIFAAAMSTVSTSLNSSATLLMSDFYERFFRRDATDRQRMVALYTATVVWGVLGTAMALALVALTASALDMWWMLASIFSGGMVSLFLLGMISRRAGNAAAVTAVLVGGLVIFWMVFSVTDFWPKSLVGMKSPFHSFMVIVVGTLTILLIGIGLSTVWPRQKPA
ncbi:MAG: sodium:solute symporter [Phycisphaerales bacterium]